MGNVLNLVVKRQSETLALLGGAFLRLQNQNGEEEFYASMESGTYSTLIWPIRYQVRCPRTLSYVLAPVQDQVEGQEESRDDAEEKEKSRVVLRLTNLRIEAFRESTAEGNPESVAPQWNLGEWDCEFHRTFKWAPYLVTGGLVGLVIFMISAFLCKQSLENKQGKYEAL